MARKPKKIKILFTIPNFDTAGSGKALLKIAKSLDKAIFTPEIACMHNKGKFFTVVKESGIPVHIINYTTAMKPYKKGVYNCMKIAKELKKIKPDIIHSFHYSNDYSEVLSARLAGIKWIYTKKNMNWGGSSKNSWKLRTFLSNHVIYQNTDMKKMFFPKLKKTTLISRGVDITEFYPSKENLNLKESYGFKASDRIIISVANLVPLKGIDILINAFNSFKKTNNNNWKLLIVGNDDNDYGDELKLLVKKNDLEKDIVFTGKVLNVNEHLNIAEVFVLPTIFKGEGSPVALLEAMATGLCVLGSNLPGIRDQLQNYPEHLVEAGNAKELEQKLLYFCNLPKNVIEQIGNVFLKQVLEKYKLENEVKLTSKVYQKLMK